MSHIEYVRKNPKQCKKVTNDDEKVLQFAWEIINDVQPKVRCKGMKPIFLHVPWLKEASHWLEYGRDGISIELISMVVFGLFKRSKQK